MSRNLGAAVLCGLALLIAGCGGGEGKSSGGSGSAGNAGVSGATGASTGSTSAGGSKGAQPRAFTDKSPNYASVPASAPVQSGVVKIAYRNISIDPDVVKVKVGSTVRWTNYDSTPHNVTSESGPIKFKSSDFGEGKSFEVKMDKTGVIHYECTLQPTTMNGTIEVVE